MHSAGNAIGTEQGGHQAGAAKVVYGCAAAAQPAGVQRRHAGDVTALGAGGITTAHDDVFDVVRG